MNKSGPIIVIEDDKDDKDILVEIFTNLNFRNEILYFSDGNEALKHLNKPGVSPFLILSDINMPRMNGFELRDKVHTSEKLHIKCIPYLFFTTAASKEIVIDAYSSSVQGFFLKPYNFEELQDTIRKIVEYWQECQAPNDYLF